MKYYVVGGNTGYTRFIKDVELVDKIEDAEVVLFTGGEDVTPSFYGEEDLVGLYTNRNRDNREKEIFNKIKNNQLALGICRGSQFLCAMNGGKLVQDCNNHAIGTTHGICDLDREVMYEITSTHHQMQYPYNLPSSDYEILYISSKLRSGYYVGGGIDSKLICSTGEPEVVLYKVKGKPTCLAIQGHPEMIPDSPVAKMLDELIRSTYEKIEKK